MAVQMATIQQATSYLELLNKLKSLSDSNIDLFVDLRNMDVHMKQTRDYNTPIVDAIVILEKSFYVWHRDLYDAYTEVESLNLSFTDAELVGL